MLKIYITFLCISLSVAVSAQCYIKSTDQNEGYITYYIDPELVSQDTDMGIAISVQSVGEKYYLAVTYQFASKAQAVEEKVGLELVNGYILELEMYTQNVGSANGIELCMAVFFLEDDVIKYVKSSNLKSIHFRTQGNKALYKKPVTSNAEALKRQLKCFKR